MDKLMVLFFRFLIVICLNIFVINAAKLNLSQEKYSHFSRNESVREILTDLAQLSDVRVNVSSQIKGEVNGYFANTTVHNLFDDIVKNNNLIWYYDGISLYVYNNDEIKQKFIRLYNIDVDTFKQKLIDFDIYDPQFSWKATGSNLLTIFGPPQYINIIDNMLAIIDSQNEIGVHVFPLKYAWAHDRQITVRNASTNVEGIASLLKRLIINDNTPTSFESSNKDKYHDALGGIKSLNKNANFTPQISADTRTNGIIVHDYVNKFPIYEKLIKILDVEMPLIEIAVTIIDLSVNRGSIIGTDWNVNLDHSSFNNLDQKLGKIDVSFLGGNNYEGNLASTVSGYIAPNLHLSKLVSRVKLMEQKGQGKILSRPTILTTNNLKAVLDHSKTFYVRSGSAGSQDAKVTPIDIGLNLQVTPHIIDTEHGSMIHMNIDIKDGNIIETSHLNVDNIPLTNQTQITSQATIKEGNSIILGGYYHEQLTTNVKKIPILGDLPILSLIFSNKEKVHRTMERIFIITPKIIHKNQALALPDKYLPHIKNINMNEIDNMNPITVDDKNYITKVENADSDYISEFLNKIPDLISSKISNKTLDHYAMCRSRYNETFCFSNTVKEFRLDKIIIKVIKIKQKKKEAITCNGKDCSQFIYENQNNFLINDPKIKKQRCGFSICDNVKNAKNKVR